MRHRTRTMGAMGLSVIANVNDLVEIEAGRRTSKLAVAGTGARVIVFALDTGAELAEHTAPGPILVQGLAGRLEFSTKEETVELLPGGLIHLDARVPHAVRAAEPSRMMLTIIRQD